MLKNSKGIELNYKFYLFSKIYSTIYKSEIDHFLFTIFIQILSRLSDTIHAINKNASEMELR